MKCRLQVLNWSMSYIHGLAIIKYVHQHIVAVHVWLLGPPRACPSLNNCENYWLFKLFFDIRMLNISINAELRRCLVSSNDVNLIYIPIKDQHSHYNLKKKNQLYLVWQWHFGQRKEKTKVEEGEREKYFLQLSWLLLPNLTINQWYDTC